MISVCQGEKIPRKGGPAIAPLRSPDHQQDRPRSPCWRRPCHHEGGCRAGSRRTALRLHRSPAPQGCRRGYALHRAGRWAEGCLTAQSRIENMLRCIITRQYAHACPSISALHRHGTHLAYRTCCEMCIGKGHKSHAQLKKTIPRNGGLVARDIGVCQGWDRFGRRRDDQGRCASFFVRDDGDLGDHAQGRDAHADRRAECQGRTARQEAGSRRGRSGVQLAALRRESTRAHFQGQGRGDLRMLDIGVAQIGAPGLRGTRRPAVLSSSV